MRRDNVLNRPKCDLEKESSLRGLGLGFDIFDAI